MLESLIFEIIQNNLNSEALEWVNARALLIKKEQSSKELYLSFAAAPRKTGKSPLSLTSGQHAQVQSLRPGFTIMHWSVDRLTRVYFLLLADSSDKEMYLGKIEGLFSGAEMNELVALYSSLPVLAYPADWKFRCTEGIRSNIGSVLEAIMYENPYPYEYLDEPAWNQMILKAFFTDKNVDRITGLDDRANSRLSAVLFDYAHERWAAHRPVNIQLWRLTGKFIDSKTFPDIKRLFFQGNETERKAAALACSQSEYQEALDLLNEAPELKTAISEKRLDWPGLLKTNQSE